MCRMIIAIGEIHANELIEDLSLMARGENSFHERNKELGSFKHMDGWGLAYLDENHKWQYHRSTKPIFDDESVEEFKEIRAKVIILHARRATLGEKSLDNTQPIRYPSPQGDYFMTHNGTIREVFKYNGNRGEYSDSVLWFKKLLEVGEDSQAIENFTNSLTDYTSTNFFYVTPKAIFICQNYQTNPEYYTLKKYEDDKQIIISSEVPKKHKGKIWESLKNHSLIKIDYEKYV